MLERTEDVSIHIKAAMLVHDLELDPVAMSKEKVQHLLTPKTHFQYIQYIKGLIQAIVLKYFEKDEKKYISINLC